MEPDLKSLLIGVGFLSYSISMGAAYKLYKNKTLPIIQALQFPAALDQQIRDEFSNRSYLYGMVFYGSSALLLIGTIIFMGVSSSELVNQSNVGTSIGIFIGSAIMAGVTPTAGSFLALKRLNDYVKQQSNPAPIGASI